VCDCEVEYVIYGRVIETVACVGAVISCFEDVIIIPVGVVVGVVVVVVVGVTIM
jgi:hypothetical protein